MSLATHNTEEIRALRQRREMSPQMRQGLNDQIKAELESAYFYLGVATYFDQLSLDGITHWFRKQGEEELEHAMKIYDYMRDRGVSITLPNIDAQATRYDSPLEAFEMSLDHERHVSVLIHDLYALSQKMEEYDTGAFVQWFLNEQVEEENMFSGLVDKVRMGVESGNPNLALLMLDKELAARTEAAL
jgi:ferritin